RKAMAFLPGREAQVGGKPPQPPAGIPALAGRAIDPPLTGAVHGAVLPEADFSGSISINSPPPALALAFGSRSLTGAGACVGLGRRSLSGAAPGPHSPAGGKRASCPSQAGPLLPYPAGASRRTRRRPQSGRRPPAGP